MGTSKSFKLPSIKRQNNKIDVYKTKGCFKKVYVSIERNYALIGGISFASALFILLGSLLSCGLAKNLGTYRYETME